MALSVLLVVAATTLPSCTAASQQSTWVMLFYFPSPNDSCSAFLFNAAIPFSDSAHFLKLAFFFSLLLYSCIHFFPISESFHLFRFARPFSLRLHTLFCSFLLSFALEALADSLYLSKRRYALFFFTFLFSFCSAF